MKTIDEARQLRLETDWDNLAIPVPWFLGRRFARPSVETLASRLAPNATDDSGLAGTIARLAEPGLLKPQAVYGFWPANADGDTVLVYKDDARASRLVELQMLRQQGPAADSHPRLSLADFVAPRESCAPDYIAACAISLGQRSDLESQLAHSLQDQQALRAATATLSAAFVEYVLQQIGEDWGFAGVAGERPAPRLGLRVSFGDAEAPDRAGVETLIRLLHADEIGIMVDEAFELRPQGSVVSLCFAHPAVQRFDIGAIGTDQLADYAARRGEAAAAVARRLPVRDAD